MSPSVWALVFSAPSLVCRSDLPLFPLCDPPSDGFGNGGSVNPRDGHIAGENHLQLPDGSRGQQAGLKCIKIAGVCGHRPPVLAHEDRSALPLLEFPPQAVNPVTPLRSLHRDDEDRDRCDGHVGRRPPRSIAPSEVRVHDRVECRRVDGDDSRGAARLGPDHHIPQALAGQSGSLGESVGHPEHRPGDMETALLGGEFQGGLPLQPVRLVVLVSTDHGPD